MCSTMQQQEAGCGCLRQDAEPREVAEKYRVLEKETSNVESYNIKHT